MSDNGQKGREGEGKNRKYFLKTEKYCKIKERLNEKRKHYFAKKEVGNNRFLIK